VRLNCPWFTGEAVAGTVPLTALDKDNTPAQTALVTQKFLNSDIGAAPLGVLPVLEQQCA